MSIAERTRAAVRERPFLYEALQAGVVNYTAAARFLDLGDEEAVAAALRRYADELAPRDGADDRGAVRVRMERGLGHTDGGTADGGMLVVGGTVFDTEEGELTGILATGDVRTADVQRVLGRCVVAGIDVVAAGSADDTFVLVVGRRGADALRVVEDVLEN